MSDAIKIEGADTFSATLGRAAGELEDWTAPGLKTSALIANRARSGAPRLTGRLAASHGSSANKTEAEVTNSAEYANRTHWGYARYAQAPQPWLVNATESTESQSVDLYRDRIEDVLDRVRGA